MSRWGKQGLGVALMLLLGPAAVMAGDPPGTPDNWFLRWLGPAKKPAPAKDAPAPAKDGPEKTPPARPVSQVEAAAAERDRELQEMFRRQAVCLKMMSIAQQTHDDELMHRAERLHDQAREVYEQRTAHLPTCNANFESDEKTLETYLGPASAAPNQSGTGSSYAVPGKPVGGQARAPEEKP
jgi:hypothetical protein